MKISTISLLIISLLPIGLFAIEIYHLAPRAKLKIISQQEVEIFIQPGENIEQKINNKIKEIKSGVPIQIRVITDDPYLYPDLNQLGFSLIHKDKYKNESLLAYMRLQGIWNTGGVLKLEERPRGIFLKMCYSDSHSDILTQMFFIDESKFNHFSHFNFKSIIDEFRKYDMEIPPDSPHGNSTQSPLKWKLKPNSSHGEIPKLPLPISDYNQLIQYLIAGNMLIYMGRPPDVDIPMIRLVKDTLKIDKQWVFELFFQDDVNIFQSHFKNLDNLVVPLYDENYKTQEAFNLKLVEGSS